MTERLTISELGAQGDGISHTPQGLVYVPFALPGEVVVAQVEKQRGRLVSIETPSPLRVEPVSPHFGTCGGCAVQHLATSAYAEWKREKVVRALRSRRLMAEVGPLVLCPPASRRRVTLTACRSGSGVQLGFNAAQSHRIVEIEQCPVALPEISAALPDLRLLAGLIAAGPRPFHLTVTATRTGLDIAADSRLPGEEMRRKAIDFVLAKGFARLSVGGEVLVEREKPVVLFGDVPVVPPPGGFLQATEHAEQVMADLVLSHLTECGHVADLFAGCGTFALRLARSVRVRAVEGNTAALAALDAAARHAQGLKPVTTQKRDLFYRPLTAKELSAFDGLVFDPPRAGAEAQCRQIAVSRVTRVVAVSCNPGTLARDLAILTEGGYRLVQVTPIDQFLWSPHVEVVALLEKRSASRLN